MTRRRFTPEYKQEAVELAQRSDIPVSQVAKNLGLNDSVLRRWIKEYTDPSKKLFTGHGSPRDEGMARLKKELQQVKKERDFLKEAAATSPRNQSKILGACHRFMVF
jgi:transposase